MALSQLGILSAAGAIAATALAGGYVLGNMGDDANDAANTEPPAPASVTITDAYDDKAAAAENHGEMGAFIIFNETAQHFDVFHNPQNYTPRQDLPPEEALAKFRQEMQHKTHVVMATLMTETNNLAQSTLTQYGPNGHLQNIDAKTAGDLYAKTQEACADATAIDADGNPDPTGHFDEFNGQGIKTMLVDFVNDVNRCVMNLEMLANTVTYLDADGQAQTVSAEFKQAAQPVDQNWALLIRLHNDGLGASKVVNDPSAVQRLAITAQKIQNGN
jgi:hypothetical protein